MFFVGAACYVWREKIRLSYKWFFISNFVLVISTVDKDFFFVSYYFLLPYLILYAAYVPSGFIRNFKIIGDYSYGIYLYAFPVQQSIAAIIPNVPVITMIVASFSVTLFLAFLSWNLIEKKFQKMKGAYLLIQVPLQNMRLTRYTMRTKIGPRLGNSCNVLFSPASLVDISGMLRLMPSLTD